jgi:purine-nucleoside phosphorylase
MTSATDAGPDPGDGLGAAASAAVRGRADLVPTVGIVCGSGLAGCLSGVHASAEVDYAEVPGFPPPTVPGHAGRLRLGTLHGVPVAGFLGRIHFYEGHPMSLATLPVRVARMLGAETMVLTAAVGAVSPALSAGTIVVASDHLNMMGENALRGWRYADGSPPFVELSNVYDPVMADAVVAGARSLGIRAERGVYAAMPGPSYETPAETAWLRAAGAAVVGMSVVPEAVVARALGMRVLGLFAVTNAVGEHVEHDDVVRTSNAAATAMGALLDRLMPSIPRADHRPTSEGGMTWTVT